jgi:hypothetical protein
MPKDFSVLSETGTPYMPEKSVLAAVFMVASGKVIGNQSSRRGCHNS